MKGLNTCYASLKLIKCHVMSPHQYGCQQSPDLEVFSLIV